MIALNSECLLFQLASGESIPCSAEMICIDVISNSESLIDPEMLRHAAASVFYYFKTELARETVTVAEFAAALEKVLRTLGLTIRSAGNDPVRDISTADLRSLAGESADRLELLFYPRLRDEMRWLLRQSPRVLRFRGLRGCAKQLAGARRWSSRCEKTQEQIVAYLRSCLTAEPEQNHCALVVE
jgi:hypothetical protein